MIRIFKVSKNEINLPIIVIFMSIIIGIYHIFSYLVPFTSHAFVVTNVTPVAADVSGFITKIYVHNGSAVKKDEPIFEVYQEPYRLAYNYANARYEEAVEHLKAIEKQAQKTNQVAVEDQQLMQQKKLINALEMEKKKALMNLNLTTVRAPADGVVDNLYIGTGTPVKIHEPLFSFIDTSTWWVQANLYETDLRRVRPGDKVYIMLRMYYFNKIFHGRIVNTMWAVDRTTTEARTQQQKISSNNQWLLEPQRFPIQIEILDPDPKYPLNPGASAYVYIKTK